MKGIGRYRCSPSSALSVPHAGKLRTGRGLKILVAVFLSATSNYMSKYSVVPDYGVGSLEVFVVEYFYSRLHRRLERSL